MKVVSPANSSAKRRRPKLLCRAQRDDVWQLDQCRLTKGGLGPSLNDEPTHLRTSQTTYVGAASLHHVGSADCDLAFLSMGNDRSISPVRSFSRPGQLLKTSTTDGGDWRARCRHAHGHCERQYRSFDRGC